MRTQLCLTCSSASHGADTGWTPGSWGTQGTQRVTVIKAPEFRERFYGACLFQPRWETCAALGLRPEASQPRAPLGRRSPGSFFHPTASHQGPRALPDPHHLSLPHGTWGHRKPQPRQLVLPSGGRGGDLTPQAQSSVSAGTTSARQGVPQCPLQAWVRRSHFPGLPKVGGTQLSRRPRATCSLKRLPYVLGPACDRAFPCVSISGPGGGARSHGVVARPLPVDLYPGGLAFPSLKLA